MMRTSAGLLMYRYSNGELQVFLAHPGGPLYMNKDEGVWTIPKGEPPQDGSEQLLDTAIREFEEETGIKPSGPFFELGSVRQKGGKIVYAWAFEGEHEDTQPIHSNTFVMQWPPRSGREQSFPEVDRGAFFSLPEAGKKLKDTQWPLVERLVSFLESRVRD